MSGALTIVWYRQDLRVSDNPALAAAASHGAVLPLYVWSPETEGAWPAGAASRFWLHHSLHALSKSLANRGAPLVVLRGDPDALIPAIARESGADSVVWNRRHEPDAGAAEVRLEAALADAGCRARAFDGSTLFGPDEVRTGQGEPYKVFTPFWKACLALPPRAGPLPAPSRLETPAVRPASLEIEDLALLPRAGWAAGIGDAWTPGERGARAALDAFLEKAVSSYADDRDRPDLAGTSRLSPHLHFGEISPGQIWHETRRRTGRERGEPAGKGADGFLRQLVWREFAHHLLHHFPHTNDSPLREEFSRFPWRGDPGALEKWRRGSTGFPLVDAGMRELWATGWMHNRVRMVVASFLVKDLLVHWLEGARWFWDTLVDADLANNTFGWQWTSGCGADAAPFFRVFNPMMQGEKFDPEGAYVRRWVPELGALPDRWIHKPWQAPPGLARDAGVEIGKTYPAPIVDHHIARNRALAALATLKRTP